MDSYLNSTIKQFYYYKSLGEKSFEQLSDDHLFYQHNEDCNSVATIVKHLHGNMLSRWTDFMESDGEKKSRHRDTEFYNDISSRKEMLSKWDQGWACLFTAIEALETDDLDKVVYIRNQGHTVLEAINRQLAHYAYHIGQIVYIAKTHSSGSWNSLSIPRNKSSEFNKQKFEKDKSRAHFTDEFLK